MVQSQPNIFRGLALIFLIFIFCSSCSTYHQKIAQYYTHISNGNYVAANASLDRNKLLRSKRNELLLMIEKGKIFHLQGKYDTSNYYFNVADKIMEESRKNFGDVMAGTLVNPMMQKYRGEDFEKFMIHYYKALNYLYLHKIEDAIVEARRITLQTQQQSDKFNNKSTRYSKDAFSLMLQGIIYEAGKDINNAFIAYRNAVEVYLNSPDKTYYGVKIPQQLKKDVIRTAYLNGFYDEQDRFESMFNLSYKSMPKSQGGDLIIFWENGLAPIKDQQDFFFSMHRGNNGFYFMDLNSNIIIPFNTNFGLDTNNLRLQDFDNFRVSFPKYITRPLYYASATAIANQDSVQLEKAQDINELAFTTLKQRFAKEMGIALSRLVVKKAAEYAVRGKNDDDSKKNAELREGLAAVIGIYNLISEKADTRNWQSLPSSIYYGRIPLQKGKNEIILRLTQTSGREEIKTITVNGNGGIIFYNYASLR